MAEDEARSLDTSRGGGLNQHFSFAFLYLVTSVRARDDGNGPYLCQPGHLTPTSAVQCGTPSARGP